MRLENMKKKILFVNPPHLRLYKDSYATNVYPAGLAYLAGMIKRKTDWNVMVYNADFTPGSEINFSVSYASGPGFKNYLKNLRDLSMSIWAEVRSTVAEYRPTVIGIYCCAASFASASIVAKLAREFDRQSIVVMGGPHPTTVPREVLRDSSVDVVVKGEGEETIVELLGTIEKKFSFEGVKGIAYRSSGGIIETPERPCIENLDSLGFPLTFAPEVLKDYEKYPKSAFRYVYTSRGCPYNCSFCGSRYVWSRNQRLRSVANVVEEIKSLRKIGLKWIEFGDDTFGTNKGYLQRLCESLFRECPGLLWGCETRANLIDEETVALMKEAGCRSIDIGIESGNNEMLKKIRKGITVEQSLTAADVIRKHGIKLTANFMIGFPEETEETLDDTFNVMKKIKGLLIFNIFTPYPGTETFELCRKAGLIDNEFNVALYNHQSPENCFCMNIKKERFRELALEMEKFADRHNAKYDFNNIFSFNALYKIHDYGIRWSLRKLVSVIRSL